ncbi:MAG TPA: hypothetical protein VFR20_10715 [Burkholderiaceae bacterium]|nr:hypothetical protein [Burkholderiaceae bacterium]
MPHPSKVDGPSLSTLLLRVLGSLAVIVFPLAIVAALPALWGAAVIAALFALVLAAFRVAGRKPARAVLDWIAGAALGLGVRVWLLFPFWWGPIPGIAVVALVFFLQVSLAQRLSLELPGAGPPGGTRADRHFQRRQTPEGQPLRFLDWGEVAMGYGAFHSILFPDGVVLQGVGDIGRFSVDGRYFAAICPSRGADGLIILDRETRRLYQGTNRDGFWALEDFAESPANDKPREGAGPSPVFGDFLARTQASDLMRVGDLWLDPQQWSHRLENLVTHEYLSPDHQHKLVARHFVPASLRDLEEPLKPLYEPQYALWLDGEDTGLLTDAPESVSWRADSQALACRARQATEPAQSLYELRNFWLWENGKNWRALPSVWASSSGEPALTEDSAATLDARELRLRATLANPELSHGNHGYSIACLRDKSAILIGHDDDGRMRLAGYPCRPVRLCLPLDSPGGRGAARVKSCEFQNGEQAEFTWIRDNAAGLGAWHCRIGDWHLPGLWLLDHRVSDDGRRIALCPFPDIAPVAETFRIATPTTRELQDGPDMLISCLVDFYQDDVSVVEIAGRVDRKPEPGEPDGTPLDPFQTPAPVPALADDFFRPCTNRKDDAVRYYYRLHRFRVGDVIVALPRERTVTQAQAAYGDGDFIYPCPNGADAAWFFGGGVSYGVGWPPAGEPRSGGYLLTASGCAVGDLAPPMSWSEDGRLLALCRLLHLPDGKRQWRLLLLDPAYGMLRVGTRSLGGMPIFERFDAEGLSVKVLNADWLEEGASATTRRFSLRQLTGMPAVALNDEAGLRLAPDQEQNRALWSKLDKLPLAPYRSA